MEARWGHQVVEVTYLGGVKTKTKNLPLHVHAILQPCHPGVHFLKMANHMFWHLMLKDSFYCLCTCTRVWVACGGTLSI